MRTELLSGLLLAGAVVFHSPAGEEFSVKEKNGDIQVSCEGTVYHIVKNVQPKWSACKIFRIGESEDDTLSFMVNSLTPMPDSPKSSPVLLPNGRGARLTIMEDHPDCKRIRTEYPLSPLDSPDKVHPGAVLQADFVFMRGIPGAAVDAKVTGRSREFVLKRFTGQFGSNFEKYAPDGKNPVAYTEKDWRPIRAEKKFVIAEKGAKSMLVFPAQTRTPGRGFVAIGKPNEFVPVKLAEGESTGLRMLFGFARSESDTEKLFAFRQASENVSPVQPQDTSALPPDMMRSYPVRKPPSIGSFSGWDGIPAMAERDRITDYRPAEANNWTGPQDLSFRIWSAFDSENLYLRIRVLDDEVIQPAKGSGIWSGDCVQLAFDPLCEEKLSPNIILIGIAPTNPVTVCAWTHPDKDMVRDDISSVVKSAVRIIPGGYECEMAIPWNFLHPFKLKYGKLGFNAVVLDGGRNWMGITDGIAGGKDPGLYKKLAFPGMEKALFANQKEPSPEMVFPDSVLLADDAFQLGALVFINRKDLGSELGVEVGDFIREKVPLREGFNSFQWKYAPEKLVMGETAAKVYLLKDGKKLHLREYPVTLIDSASLLSLAGSLEKQNIEFRRKVDEITKRYGVPSYLLSRSAVTQYFIEKTRMVCRDKDLSEKNRTRYKRTASRLYRNLVFCRNLLSEGMENAGNILAGKEPCITVPRAEKGTRPVIANGGFSLGGREIFFVGANTWMLRDKGNENVLQYLAESGLNFFNLVNVSDAAKRKELILLAEKLGLYHNRREPANHIRKTYLYKDGHSLERKESCLSEELATPSLVYFVAHEETQGTPPVVGEEPKEAPQDSLREKTFRDYLEKKFGNVRNMNLKLGTHCGSFGEIAEKTISDSIPLKYEYFLCMSPLLSAASEGYNDALRKFGGVPLSTHFTELNFRPYDTLGICGDFDRHWGLYELPGFDAGSGPAHKKYAMNFSGRSVLLTDMARSFYPERPTVNNEEYIVNVGNPTAEPPMQYHYMGVMLPALHGRCATSIFSLDQSFTSSWGDLTFRRADAFFMTAKAALDLRRFAPEISSFRSAPSPTAILYTLPSYAQKDYPDWMISAYEGAYFSGFPVRFISDRLIRNGKLNDYSILLVPNAQFVQQEVFDKIAAFVKHGGKVLCYGKDSLALNEYGQRIPGRDSIRKSFIFLSDDTPESWFAGYEKLLRELKKSPEVEVKSLSGKDTFGIEYRSIRGKDGRKLLYILNLNKTPVRIQIPGRERWTDLIGNSTFPEEAELQPLEFHLLREK